MSTPYNAPPPPPQPAAGPSGEPPLNQPYYGAPFGAAIRRFFGKYATFSGRASRAEFWWWFLADAIVIAVLQIVGSIGGGVTGNGSGGPTVLYVIFSIVLVTIWGLGTIVPNLALSWRRFHDSNHSGGFWFLGLIPIVGWIIVLIFMLLGPSHAGARFDR